MHKLQKKKIELLDEQKEQLQFLKKNGIYKTKISNQKNGLKHCIEIIDDLIDEHNIYIGASSDYFSRLGAHLQNRKFNCALPLLYCNTLSMAKFVESSLIYRYRDHPNLLNKPTFINGQWIGVGGDGLKYENNIIYIGII